MSSSLSKFQRGTISKQTDLGYRSLMQCYPLSITCVGTILEPTMCDNVPDPSVVKED
jgi:hypothetical protein